MEILVKRWTELAPDERRKILSRSESDISAVLPKVEELLRQIRLRGDEALFEYSLKFDRTDLSKIPVRVSEAEFDRAEALLDPEVKSALDYAIANVRKFHQSQKPEGMTWLEVRPGLLAGERPLPIESVGLYVPRGRGSFPSMVYMLAVPAMIAGVGRIVMVSPPLEDGSLDPACLYAARLCGISEVYRIGGAQAVAALAYGTESIKPVVKIIGPGSQWVTAAKRLLFSVVDVGLPAGPSESAILADQSADPWRVALDLLVEAEHGSDSSAILVTDSETLAKQTALYISALVENLEEPRRSFVKDVFSGYGGIILVDSQEAGAALINEFAPEHLSLQTEEPFSTLSLITNAGEILLGQNLPFSAANYATGPNAVLPTGGKAKTYSPVSVRDFMKYSSVIYATPQGYESFKTPVLTLADYEGFVTHAQALRKRGEAQ